MEYSPLFLEYQTETLSFLKILVNYNWYEILTASHEILNPYLRYFDPSTYGILTSYPWNSNPLCLKLWVIYYGLWYLISMHCLILNTCFLLALLGHVTCNYLIFDRMTSDVVIIDHVIDMTQQYWLHLKTKWPLSLLEFQRAR